MISADRVRETGRSLADWFGAGLRAAPQATALTIGPREFSYAELDQLARVWAGTLLAAVPGVLGPVGVLANRTPVSYAGVLAAMYAGSAAVPLSPDFPVERIAATARSASLSAVITDQRGYRAAAALRAALPGLPVLGPPEGAGEGPNPGGLLAPDPLAAIDRPRSSRPQDTAYILFTSGSTGRPKGVPITHSNMDHFIRRTQSRYAFGPDDVFSQTFDQTFDLFMFDIFMAWACGARVVSTPAQAFVNLPRFITNAGLTVWFSVPSAIALIRRRGGLFAGSMESLRLSLFCGEPLSATSTKLATST